MCRAIRCFVMALGTMPACVAGIASAELADPATQIFAFSAFGTLGAVHSSQDQADFTGNVFQRTGAGYSRNWSAVVDSLIAGQLKVRLAAPLSAVAQVIAEQNYDGTFRPHLEWGYLNYQFTPDFSVRLGRAELPTFLYSDSRKVGYTYPWVRPPIEVYGLLPISASDGVHFSDRLHLGDLINTLQGSYVQSNFTERNEQNTGYARDSINLSDSTEYEALTFRISYQNARLTNASADPFLDRFRMFGSQGAAITQKYRLDDKPAVTEVISASYDPGHWFVVAEWGHARLNSFLGNDSGWYASGGYRMRNFTPYLTYAQLTANSNSDPGLKLYAVPPSEAGLAAGLNAGLNGLLQQTIAEQRTACLGARWDFTKSVDLKLQIDHARQYAGSYGYLVNIQPGLRPGGTVNLFTATVDFVF